MLEARLYEERTLEEVGEVLGVTRECIRQIEVKALAMVRRRIGKDPRCLTIEEPEVDEPEAA